MADPVSQFLEVASREVAKRELGYDQQMVEEDPEKAEAVVAIGKRFMDDVDDIVLKMTATLAEKYDLKYIPDKMRISLYEAIAQEAYMGNISINSIENNEHVQSIGEVEAKEQKRVEVVQSIMDKCADVALAYTITSAVAASAIELVPPSKVASEAVKSAIMGMTPENVTVVRRIVEDYLISGEKFKETAFESKKFLDIFEKYETQSNPIVQGLRKEIPKELDKAVTEQRFVQGAQMEAIMIGVNSPNKTPGTPRKMKPQVVKERTFNVLNRIFRQFEHEKAMEPSEVMKMAIEQFQGAFPKSEENSPELNEMLNQKLIEIQTELKKGIESGDIRSSLLNLLVKHCSYTKDEDRNRAKILAGAANPRENTLETINKVAVRAGINRLSAMVGLEPSPEGLEQARVTAARNKAKALRQEEFKQEADEKASAIAEINRITGSQDKAVAMIRAHAMLTSNHDLPKDRSLIDFKALGTMFMRCQTQQLTKMIEKIEFFVKKYADDPVRGATARDLRNRYYILSAAHAGIVDVKDKDQMAFMMINGATNLLEMGVPSDEVRESLSGAVADSGLFEPEKCLTLFDDLYKSRSKGAIEDSLARAYEKLDLGDVQPGDGNRFVDIVAGNISQNTAIQEDINYTQMASRVKNKELLKNAIHFMEMLENPVWAAERDNGLEILILQLRTKEPELHEYMLSRLEKVDQSLRIDRINDRVDKIARKKGLYHETEDGRFEIDGEEYNRLYDKYEKLTKGTYADLIAHEREEAQKLREEREIEETVPVVEEHLEETPEDQSKTERDDDDYTM